MNRVLSRDFDMAQYGYIDPAEEERKRVAMEIKKEKKRKKKEAAEKLRQ